MLIQWIILTLVQTLLFGIGAYAIHLHYVEKIEATIKEINEEYDSINKMIDDDLGFKHEVSEKRLYKKHLDKLKFEIKERIRIINFVKQQARNNRIYKKYFIINNKEIGEQQN